MIFKRFINSIWIFFCSLKLTLITLIIIFLACIIGMFWEQQLPPDYYVANFSNKILYNIFIFLELYNVFNSFWFNSLILILSLNLIACSIEKLPIILNDIKTSPKILNDKLLEKLFFTYRLKSKNKDKIYNLAEKFFLNSDLINTDFNGIYWFKQKYKYARLGVYIIHFSLLFIIFGSMLNSKFGVDGFILIPENEIISKIKIKKSDSTSSDHILKFKVKCINFKLNKFADNSVMSYESNLEIYNNKSNRLIANKIITVNNPLKYDGYTFYQASYSSIQNNEKIEIVMNNDSDKIKSTYLLNIFDKLKLNSGITIIPLEVMRNFSGLGLSLKIKKILKNKKVKIFTIFKNHKDFNFIINENKHNIIFKNYVPSYATGLSVSKKPFMSIIFFGFFLLCVGLFTSFAINNKRYYGRIMYLNKEEKYEFIIAIWGKKNKSNLNNELKILKDLLR